MLLLALCAPLAACGSDARPTEPVVLPTEPSTPDSTASLPAGVHALAGLEATLPYNDLAPFRAIVGEARFVALGESTHRSAGYYKAKVRLIRFMVEEMGFRVVAFESSWLEALPAARYVASCTGTATAAVASLNGVWRDTNVRDMLAWLCDYNRQHPGDPVTFFGFDIQEPWRSAPAVKAFVQDVAPADSARVEPLFQCLGAKHKDSRDFYLSAQYRDFQAGRKDAGAHEQCVSGIAALEEWISSNEAALTAASSHMAVEEARVSLIALRAWENQLWVPDPGGYQARDHGMAQVLTRLHALHTPGQKTIIWAWNWHIARRYEEVRGFNQDPHANVPRQGARAMGSFLHEQWGSSYLPIALIGYRIHMSGGISVPVPTHPDAVEKRLDDLGRDYLLVDLRQPVGRALLPPGQTYQVSQEWGDPYRQFDALVYLGYSGAMIHVAAESPPWLLAARARDRRAADLWAGTAPVSSSRRSPAPAWALPS